MAELSPELHELVEAARAARERAYCPYSRFAVGAAIRTATGVIIPGCNIENAAYPDTICAERAALAGAYATGQREIVALAVIADTAGPVSPCGSCRQIIAELAPRAVIVLANLAGAFRVTSPAELLPDAFPPESLPPR